MDSFCRQTFVDYLCEPQVGMEGERERGERGESGERGGEVR